MRRFDAPVDSPETRFIKELVTLAASQKVLRVLPLKISGEAGLQKPLVNKLLHCRSLQILVKGFHGVASAVSSLLKFKKRLVSLILRISHVNFCVATQSKALHPLQI